MKLLFCVLFVLAASFPSFSFADDYVDPGTFTWGIGVGGALTGTGFGPAYNGGYGLDGNIGFVLNQNLTLLLAIDSFIFQANTNGYFSGEANFLPSLRYSFTGLGIKPYLQGGVGLNENTYFYPVSSNMNDVTTTSLAIGIGAGIEIPVNDHFGIYFQGKYEEDFPTGGGVTYFPISLGVQFLQD
jgi:hypothetical protein